MGQPSVSMRLMTPLTFIALAHYEQVYGDTGVALGGNAAPDSSRILWTAVLNRRN
jgi:hypothetical protein